MLILSRRLGEALLIGKDASIVILAIHGTQVSLGIKAPPALRILRSELAPDVTSLATLPSTYAVSLRDRLRPQESAEGETDNSADSADP